MTAHTCTKHEPGTPTCYDFDRCRCDACHRAKLRRRKGYEVYGPGLVDATGTRRRIQAMVAIGWTLSWLSQEAGHTDRWCHDILAGDHRILRSHADEVRALYGRLWDKPRTGPYATRAIRQAQRRGWPVPLAWDDDTIDDPTAKPCGVLPPAMTRTRAERERRIESVRDLLDVGEDPERIAARLGVDVRALTRMLRRHAPELAKHFNAAERRAAA